MGKSYIQSYEYRKCLTNNQYKVCMKALGYTYNEELGKFFMGDSAFLCNVGDDVTEVADLMLINENGQPTYIANVICDFMNKGAKLTIGKGAIDDYGIKHKKGLYCSNYRKLFYNKKRIRNK